MTDATTAKPVQKPAQTAAGNREEAAALAFTAPALFVLIAFFAIPLALLLVGSFSGPSGFSLAAYERLLGTKYYLWTIWNSLRLAILTTVIALLIGYPASFALARARGVLRSALLACLFLPLAASVIVKAFAWTILLRTDGIVNRILTGLHIVGTPIRMIFTETALIVGAVNIFLPFMILPIYAVVAQLDRRLPEAAATLGANPVSAFFKVTLPLTLQGIVAGVALVFSLSVSAYVVPTLLIGERYPTLAQTIAKAFLLAQDPAFGAAAGVVLLTIAFAAVAISARLTRSPGAVR
jgi:putative spermidine/putrescine transport system permease protein